MIILTGSIVAIASLVSTLLNEEAIVPHTTSIPTLVVLSGQGIAYYTLGLLGSAAGAAAGLFVWGLIAYYKAPADTLLISKGRSLSHRVGRIRTAVTSDPE